MMKTTHDLMDPVHSGSGAAGITNPTAGPKVHKKRRTCPQCGSRLTWVETRRWNGVVYDYYRECMSGCGLVCFNRTSRFFEVLVSGTDSPTTKKSVY